MDSKRTRAMQKRRQIRGREEKNALLCARLLPFLKEKQSIGCYIPIGEEANVLPALENRLYYAPRVLDQGTMAFFRAENLEKGSFGILEPPAGEEVVPEVLLIPLLAFWNGYRLGYGGGFYDRYLSKHPECIRIGIAYDEQEDPFEIKNWDERLDWIITPTRVLSFERTMDAKNRKEGTK